MTKVLETFISSLRGYETAHLRICISSNDEMVVLAYRISYTAKTNLYNTIFLIKITFDILLTLYIFLHLSMFCYYSYILKILMNIDTVRTKVSNFVWPC